MRLILLLFLFCSSIFKEKTNKTILKEDFGLFDDFSQWNDVKEILSEVNLRNILQEDGLRYRMAKTDNELLKEGAIALVPFFKFGDFELYPPCAISEDERGGWNSTSNNEARKLEKIKAKKKIKQIKTKFKPLQKKWLNKYGYTRYVGEWFYADQLSSDTKESGGGFNMKKGGYYPDGSYKKPD